MVRRSAKQTFILDAHDQGPYPRERRRYLAHLIQEGRAASTLRDIATVLKQTAARVDLGGRRMVQLPELDLIVEDWLRHVHRQHVHAAKTFFLFHARGWLRFLHRLDEPQSALPFESVVNQCTEYLERERGFAPATLENVRQSAQRFLVWYASCEGEKRGLSGIALQDITDYFASDVAGPWSRVTVAYHVARLRTFFRYAGLKGLCLPTLADTIDAPRLYTHERLPIGPPWSQVQQLIDSVGDDTPASIRNRAMLLLLAVYGFRSGEVRKLALDHIDWENEVIRPPRPKQHKTSIYPLTREVGDAILRYLKEVRPPCRCREVFVSLKQPYRPLSGGALVSMVTVRQKRLGQRLRQYGPHSLRHACATYLLAEGFTLKQIGDQLGHTMVRATEIYAKVDLASLRKVADLDIGSLVEQYLQCEQNATPFYSVEDRAALREVANVSLGGLI